MGERIHPANELGYELNHKNHLNISVSLSYSYAIPEGISGEKYRIPIFTAKFTATSTTPGHVKAFSQPLFINITVGTRRRDAKTYATTVRVNPILAETERGHSCPHERRRDANTYAATRACQPYSRRRHRRCGQECPRSVNPRSG